MIAAVTGPTPMVRNRAVSALRAPVRWVSIERRAASRIRSAFLRPSTRGMMSSAVAVPRTVRAAATASIASDLPWACRELTSHAAPLCPPLRFTNVPGPGKFTGH